ncbi:MAG: hypothetical protein HWE27_04920 [Gammaproteobacteria bacterium]|nr:hypothetical protein [Gammaproteobacteria bacterium]
MLKTTIMVLLFSVLVSKANAQETLTTTIETPQSVDTPEEPPTKPPEWVCVLAPQLCGDKKPPVARP